MVRLKLKKNPPQSPFFKGGGSSDSPLWKRGARGDFSAQRKVRTLCALPFGLSIMAAFLVATLSACMVVGPDYLRPTVITPDAYKEIDGWKIAQPKDDVIRGSWWEMFGDPQLNALEAQVSISNQNLAVAEAQYRESQALVREARASYFPTVTIGIGSNRSSQSTTTGTGPTRPRTTVSDYSLAIDGSWELDVWGRIRRTVESNQANAQASAADLEAARLSAQAALAQDYFQLRMLDAQKQLLDASVAAFEKSLELTKNRYASGIASSADVLQAETQLKTTQAQAIEVGVARAQMEHAIAVLIGLDVLASRIAARRYAAGDSRRRAIRAARAPAGHRCCRTPRSVRECSDRRCRSRVLPKHHPHGLARLGELGPVEVVHGGESFLVCRGEHLTDRIRRGSAAGAKRLRASRL
jgi:hypothetical protein